ncbi:MAG: DUF3372 domain-containing protein [Burkholderiales bacterium]|nr:DUF3372 domain-containing protein [Burkholderiales bacterium]
MRRAALPVRAVRPARLARRWLGLAALSLAAVAAHARAPDPSACDGPAAQPLQAAAAPAGQARAVWLGARWLRWPQALLDAQGAAAADTRFVLAVSARGQVVARPGEPVVGADALIPLDRFDGALPPAVAERFRWVGAGPTLALRSADAAHLPDWLRGRVLLVAEDGAGRVRQATATQLAGALDALYAAAGAIDDFGARPGAAATTFKLWAPTAQAVWLCLHAGPTGPATRVLPLQRDPATGAWAASLPQDLRGGYYRYLVDVFVPGLGLVRNRVTDPYALSLSTDSRRTWIGRLADPALQPPGWGRAAPRPVPANTDLVIYELHVRDFSATDRSVRPAWRGKYLAFTESDADGMRHLKALAEAGVTDVHLLPVFDFSSVPEQGCVTPHPRGGPASESQQALVRANAARDCFNWGYDPYHYMAPEGSYATDAADGAVRVLEFRRMVQALHAAGLRVGMDLVFNHTAAAGQAPHSVLDRIVPGYYQRLDPKGAVATSTCCADTATENLMMGKLMIDAAVVWARDYGIDSFRFDLMGHQPRAAMLQLQRAVDAAAGHHIPLIGEGWNFGEVADGARFVQAAQGRLDGTGIATFSDRARDAVRGGGCCDDAAATLQRQGWINGLHLAPNAAAQAAGAGSLGDLQRAADLVRVGLAGTLRDYRLATADGRTLPLGEIDYAGHGAGYASQPGEVVNYVENHDNATLFDIDVLKLPQATPRHERARVQLLGLAVTAFSQGVAYFHAGGEALRSKSLDRNSFDSGDWFNRIDWSFNDNHYGSGLPPEPDNGALWPAMRPLLADPAIKPTPADIRFTRDAFFDLLRIRASSTLLRLRSADEVQARLRFLNTGPQADPALIVGHLDGRGLPGAGWAELLYAINVDTQAKTVVLPTLKGHALVLHPVLRSRGAADRRPAEASSWDAGTATLHVPARTALVYVSP